MLFPFYLCATALGDQRGRGLGADSAALQTHPSPRCFPAEPQHPRQGPGGQQPGDTGGTDSPDPCPCPQGAQGWEAAPAPRQRQPHGVPRALCCLQSLCQAGSPPGPPRCSQVRNCPQRGMGHAGNLKGCPSRDASLEISRDVQEGTCPWKCQRMPKQGRVDLSHSWPHLPLFSPESPLVT